MTFQELQLLLACGFIATVQAFLAYEGKKRVSKVYYWSAMILFINIIIVLVTKLFQGELF